MDKEADILKVLGDPLRLRLVILLAREDELCVCKLVDAVDEPQFKVSRHLGVLRNAGLVQARREGTWMHYRLADSHSVLFACLQECLAECLNTHPAAREDFRRLEEAKCKV